MHDRNASNKTHRWMNPHIPFLRNHLLHLMMGAYILFWVAMAVSPKDRAVWMVENILPVGIFLLLAFTFTRFRFSNLSYLFMFIFLCLHTWAAHYTYQGTPFDTWLKASFHTERSYFDRVVHFLFGLFWTYPLRELLVRMTGLRGFWSYAIPAALAFGFTSLFEIVEMLAGAMGGKVGQDYMGMQGDIFDSQKDMGLGLAGSVLSMGAVAALAWKHPGKT